MSSEPAWANSRGGGGDGSGESIGDVNTTISDPSIAGPPKIKRTPGPAQGSSCRLKFLSLLNMLLGIDMAALGVLAIMGIEFKFSDIDQGIIALYMIIFATLLFLYELIWWTTIQSINKLLRKNFGFMYAVRGKGCYLVFVACLVIGINKGVLGNMEWLRYLSGIAWLAVGLLHIFLYYWRPEYVSDYKAPTAGFDEEPATNPV